MKLTILGGGGFRVPLIYRTLLEDHELGRVNDLWLYDKDSRRLKVIAQVLAEQAKEFSDAPKVTISENLGDALCNADFIFSAIRVGGLVGRVHDERIALNNQVIGQETVGAGGISYALRTIPVAMDYAKAIKRYAPDSWTINFTNPAGVITEAMASVLGSKVIGICDSPVGLVRRTMSALGLQYSDNTEIDYVGLNHLGWLRALKIDGENVLPRLLASSEKINCFEEGRLFGSDWIQHLGAIPNEYLYYYYYTREQLEADLKAKHPRGDFLLNQQQRFYDCFDHSMKHPYMLWEETRAEREATYMETNREAAGNFDRDEEDLESGGYDRVALAIMRAISKNELAKLILNVPNCGLLSDLDDQAVIEVPCVVDQNGPRAIATSQLPSYARPLVIGIKNVERHEIAAAMSGSRHEALLAFAEHPLIDSVKCAQKLLEQYSSCFDNLSYLR